MITILIVVLLIWRSYRIFDKKEGFFNLLPITAFVLTAALLVAMVLMIGDIFQVESHRENHARSIYSLRNSDGVSGKFCLGSGYINSTEYYYLFVRNEKDGNIRWRLRAANCIIYQTDKALPNIAWQKIYYRHSKWVHIWPKIEWERDSIYDLYVPSNSIVESFNIK